MDYRKIFNDKVAPEDFDKWRFTHCDELFADVIAYAALDVTNECVSHISIYAPNMTLEEPHKTKFYAGIRETVLSFGNKITLNNTIILYLAKKA